MTVYVVTMSDPYQEHFMGVFASHNLAQEYVNQYRGDSHFDEKLFITEEKVHS
jgi:hypothetical protein